MSADASLPERPTLAGPPRTWVVTGAAGFIGSHLVERLLALDQRVVGVDDLSTGREANLAEALERVRPEQARRFRFERADVREPQACARALSGADVVLHQAGLGSVPRSIADPVRTHEVNVGGLLRVLLAARDAGVRRVVHASSSSVYGDAVGLPRREAVVGAPLSPYAASKACCEAYAHAFARCYGLEVIGLRYFNVFGPRQDPAGPYAAVIPRWIRALLRGDEVVLHGDGTTSRDFCFVSNVVDANLLAATTANPEALDAVFNVGCGEATTLAELFAILRTEVARARPRAAAAEPARTPPRAGDVPHSLADVSRARALLGYAPAVRAREGLATTAAWFAAREDALGIA